MSMIFLKRLFVLILSLSQSYMVKLPLTFDLIFSLSHFIWPVLLGASCHMMFVPCGLSTLRRGGDEPHFSAARTTDGRAVHCSAGK